MPLKVAILVGGMPTGADAFLLARRDESLAAAAIVMATTLLSAVSFAIWLQVVTWSAKTSAPSRSADQLFLAWW